MTMDMAIAQQILWERLFQLEATGSSGFEGFLAAVLRELTEKAFYVVKAGSQGGSDVRSDPANLVRIALESKRYGTKTRLPVDALLHKLTEASTADPPPDLWILASTREIDSTDREKLHGHGNDLGICVAVWDWPGERDNLCDLAAVCGSAPEAWKSYLDWSNELGEVLALIRAHGDLELKTSHWRRQLVEPDVGYANGRERCGEWLTEAQGSLANAKSRLGGHHDLRSSRYGVVRRCGPAGLSARNPCARALFVTAPMRCRTRRAVTRLIDQIGNRRAMTSVVVTALTDLAPIRGNA